MIEWIVKGLCQWIYGLFLDMVSYCANSLLVIMGSDLTFFEDNVPIVPKLYGVFIAVGWGLLIGNCVFQSMKAMFAGMGFETDPPAVLLLRTFLFGFLLIFSRSICDICLSISKRVIDMLGIPKNISLRFPTESYFSGGASWVLVIVVGFILGIQLFKLFFEIAQRYVMVGILSLLLPVGLSMGGSKSTKDICNGYVRMLASMIVLMVANVLFLKLILSALSNMPSGSAVLPWCLLVVGLAKAARKADQMLFKIGMNPAGTGGSLSGGKGLMAVTMAARTMMQSANRQSHAKGGRTGAHGGRAPSSRGGSGGSTGGFRSHPSGGHTANVSHENSNDVGVNASAGDTKNNTSAAGNTLSQTASSNVNKGGAINRSSATARFGSNPVTNIDSRKVSGNDSGLSGGGSRVNTDRFGIQKDGAVVTRNTRENGTGSPSGSTSQIQKSKPDTSAHSSRAPGNRFGSAPPPTRQAATREHSPNAKSNAAVGRPDFGKQRPGPSHRGKPAGKKGGR